MESICTQWDLPKGYFNFPSEVRYLPSSLLLHNITTLAPQLKAAVQIGDTFLDLPLARPDAMSKFVGIFLGFHGDSRS